MPCMNSTFKLVPLLPGQHAVTTWWVLHIKPDGSHKARWVVQGFSQQAGLDYESGTTVRSEIRQLGRERTRDATRIAF